MFKYGPAFFRPSPMLSGEIEVNSNHWYAFSANSHSKGALGERKIVFGRLSIQTLAIPIKSLLFAPYP